MLRYPRSNPHPVLSPLVVQTLFLSHFHVLLMGTHVYPEKKTYGLENGKQEAATRLHWQLGTFSSEACVGKHCVCYAHRGYDFSEASCENTPGGSGRGRSYSE